MKSAVVPEKARRIHANLSKVKCVVDETCFSFSLTRQGLVIRKRHSPKTTTLTFHELIRATAVQRQLL